MEFANKIYKLLFFYDIQKFIKFALLYIILNYLHHLISIDHGSIDKHNNNSIACTIVQRKSSERKREKKTVLKHQLIIFDSILSHTHSYFYIYYLWLKFVCDIVGSNLRNLKINRVSRFCKNKRHNEFPWGENERRKENEEEYRWNHQGVSSIIGQMSIVEDDVTASHRTNVSLRGTAAPLSLNLLSNALATCYAAKRLRSRGSSLWCRNTFNIK